MEFSEDFAAIHGILTSVHSTVGDFTAIRQLWRNEAKISKIVDELRHLLSTKKYLRDDKINRKYEMKVRKICLFLILNTELNNKSKLTNNRVAHLLDIVPQFSKYLLTNVLLRIGTCKYFGEAICSLPVEVSLELLEHCSACIQKSDPYAILEQTSTIASSIYYKIYHMRYESVQNADYCSIKLLEKFTDILKNYITPVTDQMLHWPTVKMYQYMGRAILEILSLLQNCFTIFKMSDFEASYYQFYQLSTEKNQSQKLLNKSTNTLIECNKNLISICEANVVAVTIDVYLAWAECNHNDIMLQQLIGAAAYEVFELLKQFEDCGELPMMLNSIAVKPKTIQQEIESADEQTLLDNVKIKNNNQKLWFKGLLKHGIDKSDEVFDTFKSLIYLSDNDDMFDLLNLVNGGIKQEYDLKGEIFKHMIQIPEDESIKIIGRYFCQGLNNVYEKENFEAESRELLNKLSCANSSELPMKEISVLLLQNPTKFLTSLIDESLKNVDHLSNIVHICNFMKCVCNIQLENHKHTVLFDMIIKRLKESSFESNAETCMIQLVNSLLKQELLSEKILEKLLDIIQESVEQNDFKRATFICQICNSLPKSVYTVDCIPVISNLGIILTKIRWSFVTYTEEKVSLTSEIISLIYNYKSNLESITGNVDFKSAAEKLDSKIDSYHIRCDKNSYESNNFLCYVSSGYDKNSNHNEQVCRLLKLLPSCVPLEWELVAKYLIIDKNPVEIMQLFSDVILILSEMSKKSPDTQTSLSYCFQQFCVTMKDVIYPRLKDDIEMEKKFIKNVCRLIKRLPGGLHNSVEVSLVNLFNFDVLKSLKEDEDFVYNLVAISHLDICKIIYSKMT